MMSLFWPGPGDDEGKPLAEKFSIKTDNVIYSDVIDCPVFVSRSLKDN